MVNGIFMWAVSFINRYLPLSFHHSYTLSRMWCLSFWVGFFIPLKYHQWPTCVSLYWICFDLFNMLNCKQMKEHKYFINNHLSFVVKYHRAARLEVKRDNVTSFRSRSFNENRITLHVGRGWFSARDDLERAKRESRATINVLKPWTRWCRTHHLREVADPQMQRSHLHKSRLMHTDQQ